MGVNLALETAVWLMSFCISLKPILHYALGLRFGKVCEEKCNWLAFLPNV